MMPAIYGNSYEIVQAPGFVAIRYEMVNEVRVIPLDGRPHAAAPIKAHMGDARGYFDGDTLVVETTNFREESVYRGANADRLKLTERFTPMGGNKLEWRVTVDDPTTWTKPWTAATGCPVGLVISGGRDTAAAKMEAMRRAGIHVAESPAALGSTMVKALRG